MTAYRIGAAIPFGSLFKATQPVRSPRAKRIKNTDYLKLIRRCGCLACDNDPAGEAAHLRISAPGKPITGVGIKPNDFWTLPLCHGCHMRQHDYGEAVFWAELGLDPFNIASRLAACVGIEQMRAVVFEARETRT